MTRSLLLMPSTGPFVPRVQVGQDALGMLADGLRQLHKRRQPRSRAPVQPLVKELLRFLRLGLLENRALLKQVWVG